MNLNSIKKNSKTAHSLSEEKKKKRKRCMLRNHIVYVIRFNC